MDIFFYRDAKRILGADLRAILAGTEAGREFASLLIVGTAN